MSASTRDPSNLGRLWTRAGTSHPSLWIISDALEVVKHEVYKDVGRRGGGSAYGAKQEAGMRSGR